MKPALAIILLLCLLLAWYRRERKDETFDDYPEMLPW